MSSRNRQNRMIRILLVMVASFGALSTMMRWSWLPTGLEHTPTFLGLFMFEGWLAFLFLTLLALSAVFLHNKIAVLYHYLVFAAIASLVSCMVYFFLTDVAKIDIAFWMVTGSSLISVALCIWMIASRHHQHDRKRSEAVI